MNPQTPQPQQQPSSTPTTPQQQPAPSASPVQPATPLPPATAPPMPLPTQATPPSTPKKTKIGLIIGIVVGAVVLLLGGLAIVGFSLISKRSDGSTPLVAITDQSANTCGAKLGELKGSGKHFIEDTDIPAGAEPHNTGDSDSTREFCELAAVKITADKYIDALGAHDWDTAWSMLAESDKKKNKDGRTADWNAEFGAYSFSAARYPQLVDPESSFKDPTYGVEPCLKNYDNGWSKNIKNGFYNTPSLNLGKTSAGVDIFTRISLKLTKENNVWKVAGENNQFQDPEKALNGDTFANSQSNRDFTENYNCD